MTRQCPDLKVGASVCLHENRRSNDPVTITVADEATLTREELAVIKKMAATYSAARMGFSVMIGFGALVSAVVAAVQWLHEH